MNLRILMDKLDYLDPATNKDLPEDVPINLQFLMLQSIVVVLKSLIIHLEEEKCQKK